MNWYSLYKSASDLPGRKPGEGVGGLFSTPFQPSRTNDKKELMEEIRRIKRNKPHSTTQEILTMMGYKPNGTPASVLEAIQGMEQDPYEHNPRGKN